jgi:hypothetical protein
MQAVAPVSRKNVTKLAQLFTAGHVDVCKQGSEVALRFHTTEGLVIVRMEERHFVRDCRGPRDANGNPLRKWEELDGESQRQHDVRVARRQLELAEAPPVPRVKQRDTELHAKLAAAGDEWIADGAIGLTALCARRGIANVSTLREHLITRLGLKRYQELSALRGNKPRYGGTEL